MANTLTGLIPSLYEGLNVVSRELVGYIPAVTLNANTQRAAVGQEVRSPIGVSGPLEDIIPGPMPADSGDTTVTYAIVKITKSKAAPIRWTGEEELGVSTSGTFNKVLADQFAEGLRLLVNAMEVDLAACALANATAGSYGTAATNPFAVANDLSGFAGPLQLLETAGAPKGDMQIVVNGVEMFDLRAKHAELFSVAASGTTELLREGLISRAMGFALRHTSAATSSAFSRDGLILVERPPAMPTGGDMASESLMITDPISNLVFEVRAYRQYHRVKYEVCAAWGVAAPNPKHIAPLLY